MNRTECQPTRATNLMVDAKTLSRTVGVSVPTLCLARRDGLYRFALYRKCQYLPPRGWTNKASPSPSAIVYALSLDLAWRTAVSVSAMCTSPEVELVMYAFLYLKERVGTICYEVL